jgi:hypothetical protein
MKKLLWKWRVIPTIQLASLWYNDCVEVLITGNHTIALCFMLGGSNIVCPKH